MKDPVTQAGFGLIEVLITLTIVSAGLLTLIGLQTTLLREARISRSQMFASIAADDMADRIRANPAREAGATYAAITPAAATNPPADCASYTCTPAQMARYDAWEWQRTVSTALPGGKGKVSCALRTAAAIGASCKVYVITVAWRSTENADDGASASHCPSFSAGKGQSGQPALRCLSIEVRP